MANDAQTENTPLTGSEHYHLPNRMGRMYLLALEDTVGKNGVNAILNRAGLFRRINNYPPDSLDLGCSFEEVSALNQALEDIYGHQGGKDLAVRTGRAWFHYALKDFGAVLGIADLAFRLLPLGMKIKLGLEAMANTYNKTSDQVVRVVEEEGNFLYHIDRCPACWCRTAEVPICYTDLGLLQEGMRWVTGGKSIRVEEVLCIATGDPSCTYIIEKRPSG